MNDPSHSETSRPGAPVRPGPPSNGGAKQRATGPQGAPSPGGARGGFLQQMRETFFFNRFLRPLRGLIIVIFLAILGSALLQLPSRYIPAVVGRNLGNATWILTYLLLAIAASIASGLLGLLSGNASVKMAERMTRAIRVEVFARLEHLSMVSVISRGAGQFVQRIVRDVEQIRELYRHTMTEIVTQVVQAVVLLVALLLLEPVTTLILIGAFLLVIPFLRRVNFRVERLAQRIQELSEEIIDNMVEAVGGFRDIQVSGRFDRFHKRFEGVARASEDVCIQTGFWAHFAGTLPTLAMGVLLVAPWLIALQRSGLNTAEQIGEIVTYTLFLSQLLPLCVQMARSSSLLARAMPAVRQVKMLLGPPPGFTPAGPMGGGAAIGRPAGVGGPAEGMPGQRPGHTGVPSGPGERTPGPRSPMGPMGTGPMGPGRGPEPEPEPREVQLPLRSIRFEDVAIELGGRVVLTGLNFEIPGGKFTAIVGESGSGKTTIFHLIVRLLEPTAGRILINDTPLRAVPLSQLRKLIGFIPQNPFIFNQTLRENLLIASPQESVDDALLAQAVQTAQLGEVIQQRIAEGGLDAAAGHMGGKLSGGERQRIALGRLLLQDPQIVVCDEYTANIDVKTARVIDRTIHETFADRTRVVITHQLYTISGADHIIVVDRGTVVQTGVHEALVQSPGLYRDLWQVQTLSG